MLFLRSCKHVFRASRLGYYLHWDVDQLDEVANETHDGEADSDCLADLNELCETREQILATERHSKDLFVKALCNGSETGCVCKQ